MLNKVQESVDPTDERDTRAKYKPGDEADFERLYQASYGKILGTLTAMLGDRATAEDCAHDAFERAYRKWSTWKPIAPAEAWVHRIAINGAVSHQRKMRLREVGEVIRRIGRPELAPDPQDQIERRDLAEALSKLPPKQAAAIVLRHYHGYTNRAIAQALGIPERTVASRLAVANTTTATKCPASPDWWRRPTDPAGRDARKVRQARQSVAGHRTWLRMPALRRFQRAAL